jgi:hypothetical protein
MNPSTPATNKFKSTKKVFDIVRPGKPMASPSSRPLIVTNKPVVVDRQVTPASFGGVSGPSVTVNSAPELPATFRTPIKPPTAPRMQGSQATKRPLMRHNAVRPMSTTPETTLSVAADAQVTEIPTAPSLPKKALGHHSAKPHEVKIVQKDDKKGEGKVAVSVEHDHTPAPTFAATPTAPALATAPTPPPQAAAAPVAAPEPVSPLPAAPTPQAQAQGSVGDSLLEPLTDEEMEAIQALSSDNAKTAPILAAKKQEVPEQPADDMLDLSDLGYAEESTDDIADTPPAKNAPQSTPKPVAKDQAPEPESEPQRTVGVPNKDPELRHEDIMAGAGMTMPRHEDLQPRPVAVHHRRKLRWWQWTLIVLATLGLGIIAFNFLVDAELLKLNVELPTTDLL